VTPGAVQIQNLLYLVGAIGVATLWSSALYLLRHRKPPSMEADIASFTRGLRALASARGPGEPLRSETVKSWGHG
jgi:hypothetical protein